MLAPTTLEPKASYACNECDKRFESMQALGVHRFRMHGVAKPMRYLVDATHCPVCLLEFWNRTCAVAHLSCSKGARVCVPIVNASLTPLPAELVKSLDELERVRVQALRKGGRKQHTTSYPAIRLHGPRTQQAEIVLSARHAEANSRRTGRPKGSSKSAHQAAALC